MTYTVELSNQAEADLRGIFEHIAFKLSSLQNAAGQLSRLEKNISSLDEMPERCPRYGKEPWFSRGLRTMSVDDYCVFYLTDKQTRRVHILRVAYGGRDLDAVLEEAPQGGQDIT